MFNHKIQTQGIDQKRDAELLGIVLIIALSSALILLTIKNRSDERE
jgi:hypothetical protein